MLGRTSIIQELYMAIKNCRTNAHYVIALAGSWGSGKTTIINNVESMLSKSNVDDLIIVKTFDPWIFEEKDAMFRAMFDTIFSKIGIKFSARELDAYYGTLQKIIFGKIGLDIKYNGNNDDEVEKINTMINSYLEKNNKRVLFVIDNIERSNHEHLLLLFKSISSVFTFKRFIVLLSYDKEVMKEVFEKKLDVKYDYIDKVIQHEIVVPKLDVNIVENINEKCIYNIMHFYGLKESEIATISPIISEYSKEIKNIRDLKRNINSILVMNCLNRNYLNKIDSFIIKYVSINNNLLYESIYNNKEYFVSFNDNYMFGFDFIVDDDVFNKEIDDFFVKLFSGENKKYLGLLSLIFPYVKLFMDKRNDQIPSYKQKHLYIDKKSVKQNEARRIYNAKFWDLYFTSDVNEFLLIDISIKAFIEYINISENTYENIELEFNKVINLYTGFIQMYTVQTMEYYIGDIIINKLIITQVMYNSIKSLDNESYMLVLSARQRMEYLVSNMIKTLSDDDYDIFITKIKYDYANLGLIRSIDYWLESKKTGDYSEKVYLDFHQNYENIKVDIIENEIDIYSKQLYRLHNVYALFENEEALIYISTLINEETIYRFLADLIKVSQCSSSMSDEQEGSFEYGFDLEGMSRIISKEDVNAILNRSLPNNEQEHFIFQVYDYAINQSNTNYNQHKGIRRVSRFNYEMKYD